MKRNTAILNLQLMCYRSWADTARYSESRQASLLGQGRDFGSGARSHGPKSEAKGSRVGWVIREGLTFLRRGQPTASSLASSPSGVRAGASAAKGFLHPRGSKRPLLKIVGAKLRGGHDPFTFPFYLPVLPTQVSTRWHCMTHSSDGQTSNHYSMHSCRQLGC